MSNEFTDLLDRLEAGGMSSSEANKNAEEIIAAQLGYNPDDPDRLKRQIQYWKQRAERAESRLEKAWDLFGKDRIDVGVTQIGDEPNTGCEYTATVRVRSGLAGELGQSGDLEEILREVLPHMLVDKILENRGIPRQCNLSHRLSVNLGNQGPY